MCIACDLKKMETGKKIMAKAKKESQSAQAAVLTLIVLGIGFGGLVGLVYMTIKHFS